MEKEFDAENFVARLNRGEFDRNLFEEVRKLSPSQLEEVSKILITGLSTQTDRKDRPLPEEIRTWKFTGARPKRL